MEIFKKNLRPAIITFLKGKIFQEKSFQDFPNPLVKNLTPETKYTSEISIYTNQERKKFLHQLWLLSKKVNSFKKSHFRTSQTPFMKILAAVHIHSEKSQYTNQKSNFSTPAQQSSSPKGKIFHSKTSQTPSWKILEQVYKSKYTKQESNFCLHQHNNQVPQKVKSFISKLPKHPYENSSSSIQISIHKSRKASFIQQHNNQVSQNVKPSNKSHFQNFPNTLI